MRLKKIFNNNSILVDVGKGQEAIVFGKGVGFEHGKNRQVDSRKIQKIFYLDNKKDKESFNYLFHNIPADIITAVFTVIENARLNYHFEVYDSIYLTLSEHINGAYKLLLAGKYQENEIPDLSTKYPKEYQIAKEALGIINNKLGVEFPNSEIKSIALHFINSKIPNGIAKHEGKSKYIFDTSKLINVVLNVLDNNNVYQNSENRDSFRRFLIHLQYLAKRLWRPPEKQDSIDKKIECDMIKAYPHSYQITQEIFQALDAEFDFHPSDAERVYFIIHIHQILGKKEKE
ncbi:PRD domain-containing protein [Lactobacillus kimbladii]|uniref:PRD domain-containing protein n=1 Tax=Lactobacillus kimbladii TaxID=1218506 RepID=UPI003AF886FF